MASGKDMAALVALCLAVLVLLVPARGLALTPSGSVIRHAFTVSYLVQGAARSVGSNQSAVTVKDLNDPTLGPVRDCATQPGRPATYQHTVTNRGNAADRFLLRTALLQPLVAAGATPPKLQFFTADGVTPLPTDPSGSQITPLLASGASFDFVLQVIPPSGSSGRVATLVVTASSQGSPGREASLNDQLVVLSQELQQSQPQLVVSKVAGTQLVEAGDIVPFTVRVENQGQATLEHASIIDLLPRGFRYLKGSTLLDGSSYLDPTGGGQQLVWDLGSLEAGRVRILGYRCTVSADAPVGTAVNRVSGSGTTPAGSASLSSTATASVRVRSSLLADRAIILGRLFEDKNGNGIPDPGEPGVPGVRIYLEDGSFTFSDPDGQYSFTGVSAGNHVVKIDRATLAPRLKPVPFNTAFAGVGWSQFVTVPFGGPARADFALVGSGSPDGPAPPSVSAAGAPPAPTSTDVAPASPETILPVSPLPAVPGEVARLRVSPQRVDLPADGTSILPVTVELLNAQGRRVAGARMVTVSIARGTILEEDQDTKSAGHQVRVMDGMGVFRVRAAQQPGPDPVRVTGEKGMVAQVDLYYSAQLRDWIVVGLGSLDLGARAVQGHLEKIDKEDRFEEGFFHEERLAFFARGKILGKYLLTAAYDSDKERREGVFQYLDPEKYYPVYGDASDIGYEAQSRSKIYLKLEAGRSYLLAGDYRTDLSENEFSRYDRALNGVKLEAHGERGSVVGFESRSEEQLIRDEFPGNGTSGYYFVTRKPVFENSERIRIEVRDRYHSERVLSVVQKLRYADYSIDYSGGAILFKEPVPSLDQNLNPVTIVVVYQSSAGGAERYVYGGRGVLRANNGSYLGGTAVVEEALLKNSTLFGLDGGWQLGDRITLKGEGAVSESLERGRGSAWKIGVSGRPTEALEATGYYRKVDSDFYNPSMTGTELGTEKYGGRLDYRGLTATQLFAESFVQKQVLPGRRIFGNQAGVLHKFSLFEGEAGFKRIDQEGTGVDDTSNLLYAGVHAPLASRLDLTLRRDQLLGSSSVAEYQSRSFLKLDYRVSDATRAFVTEEYQEGHPDLRQSTRFGLESRINDRMRLTTGYALSNGAAGSTQQSSIDLNTKLLEREGFTLSSRSGYQLENSLSGNRGQAILGLNSRLQAAPGLFLDSSLERVETVQGSAGTRTAFTLAAEYLRQKDLKLTGRYEIRTGPGETAALYGAGGGYKLNQALTLLGKLSLWDRDLDAGHDLIFDGYLGSSWRPLAGNPLQLLSLVRYKVERRESLPGTDKSRSLILSLEPTYRLVSTWTLTGKYAGKKSWIEDPAGRSYEGYSDLVLAGVSYDLTERWELAAYLKLLNQYDTDQRSAGAVLRAGYRVYRNVVLSAGYNYARLDDRDLSGESFQGQGPFVGVKVKFDEEMFEFDNRAVAALPAPSPPASEPLQAIAPPVEPPKRKPVPPVPALLVAATRQDEPLRLSGSAELFTLLINGERAQLPSTSVTVNRERLGSLELRQGRFAQPLTFLTKVEHPELVSAWTLSIVNETGAQVAILKGTGVPPPRLTWDGNSLKGGKPLVPGGIYQYRLEVGYRDGSRFATGPELFGVSRKEVVLLTLSGGAFIFDSAQLTPEAKRLLRQAAEELRRHPEDKVMLEGHTDWVGSVPYNMGLSKRRCDAAADFLVREEKIPAGRLIRRWYGKSRPIADNRSAEGREKNRRVELKADFQQSIAAAQKERYRGAPFLTVNDSTVSVDALGRFETSAPAEVGRLSIQMGDSSGRFLATEIQVPQLVLAQPAGAQLVRFGTELGGLKLAPDGSGRCRVSGQCPPRHRLELDGKPVPLDAEGRFAVEVPLEGNRQVLGLVLRGPGWARLLNLRLDNTLTFLPGGEP
ncbi:hypothetical protein GMLC_06090 [Geomonas limicola]|uniref:OmpA-like domain-containing protein n=1 Tax=Geomonas limicola TaxID=2740186 RepID=A0A6V8N3U0_9BACT|nr:OmpA family protein [Geomonas limicola]GFO67030.1 hypothetical protein GMLC_06090 [Geomonas limicola]